MIENIDTTQWRRIYFSKFYMITYEKLYENSMKTRKLEISDTTRHG